MSFGHACPGERQNRQVRRPRRDQVNESGWGFERFRVRRLVRFEILQHELPKLPKEQSLEEGDGIRENAVVASVAPGLRDPRGRKGPMLSEIYSVGVRQRRLWIATVSKQSN